MARISEDEPLYIALRERLAANGLARVVDDLLALAQPAIRLDLTRVVDETAIPLGASKVGGKPDLPTGTPWPAARDSLPLPFIAQIRLADIARYEPEGDLPHEGLLSFFYAINDEEGKLRIEDDPSAWRAIWTRDKAVPLSRRATPTALNDAPDARFPACSAVFTRRLTLPEPESYEVWREGLSQAERSGYIDIATGSDVGYLPEMDLRLLGYAYELEPPTFEAAYRATHGIQLPSREGGGPGGAIQMALHALMPRSDEVQRAMEEASAETNRMVNEEWRLLLQVYSNEEAEMDWAGGGVIHFGIRREALAARDFSQVWVSLQFL